MKNIVDLKMNPVFIKTKFRPIAIAAGIVFVFLNRNFWTLECYLDTLIGPGFGENVL